MPGLSTSQFSKVLATPQGKSFSVAGFTLVTVILLVFFAIRPAYVSITDKTTENQLKEDYLETADTKTSTLIALNTSYQSNVEAIKKLDEAFLANETTEAFVTKNIVNLAVGRDVQIQGFQVDPPTEITDPDFPVNSPSIKESKFTLLATGQLLDIQSYVSSLERIPKIINIESMSYSITEDGLETGDWQLSVKGFLYSFSE